MQVRDRGLRVPTCSTTKILDRLKINDRLNGLAGPTRAERRGRRAFWAGGSVARRLAAVAAALAPGRPTRYGARGLISGQVGR
jgi:hypothetical protein